ncbi:MAG: ATP-binding protein [Desulfosalsimonadaceae bacterium]
MTGIKSMRFGSRILAAFWVVLLVAIGIPGVYIYYSLKNDFIETSRTAAFENLGFVEWLAARNQPFASDKDIDAWCTRFARQLGFRITVIEPGGRVAADSDVAWKDVAGMENHAYREEVKAALRTGTGSSIRYSDTLHRHLIYAARQFTLENYPSPMILRIAMPFSEVETRLNEYARQFWLINAFIFALALGLSIYFTRRFESPVYQIIERIRKIGTGDYTHGYIADDGREFHQLSGNINEMADRISLQVETITRQKYELAVIIENMREGILLLDKNGRIKAVNHAVEALAGCRGSCVGKTPMEIFLNNEIQAACDAVVAGMPEYSLTLELEEDLYYEVYLTAIPEGGALVVFYNVSEQKRLEKIRRDFVANVSHELKTPLTSIKGYVETLLSGPFSFTDDAKSFLQTIHKNANHMSAIVDDLLQLTRLQDKAFAKQMDTVEAAACFTAASETILPMAREKNIAIHNELKEPIAVKADESALIRIFGNLLDNAIRYSPHGGAITIRALEAGNKIVFAVEDEGPGIARQHQSRIFERFYRVEKERSRFTGGTGLGLAICKNALAGMGGDIWMQSPPEGKTHGSIFFFSLLQPDNPEQEK